ncbi:hypothetical protein C8J56DRAFT_719507, partial [Mycena floridula]
FPDAQSSIAMTCGTYLSFDAFQCGYQTSDSQLESMLKQHPFLNYSAHYWGLHMQKCGSAIKHPAVKFLHNSAKVTCAFQV